MTRRSKAYITIDFDKFTDVDIEQGDSVWTISKEELMNFVRNKGELMKKVAFWDMVVELAMFEVKDCPKDCPALGGCDVECLDAYRIVKYIMGSGATND